ncbi:hypothetical protein [Priestia koreensis]|nr:hypothetical protein [Priestia koreensis]UNL83553.1 hypothetical protein IE339_15450 [Priestia koreensis]
MVLKWTRRQPSDLTVDERHIKRLEREREREQVLADYLEEQLSPKDEE